MMGCAEEIVVHSAIARTSSGNGLIASLESIQKNAELSQQRMRELAAYIVLTHKRIFRFTIGVMGVISSITEIPISNITRNARGTGRIFPYLEVGTLDGTNYHWNLKNTSEATHLVEQFTALMDRQSAQQELAGSASELEKLAELVDRGILQKEDFERAKGLMLGKPMSKMQEATVMLESLSSLHKQGVLSESEFNMKKWDILSK